MQYLKDEIKNRIIEEALKEFNENGYKGASIRSIVKNANTSIGNFYKYFESKDDLYEVIIGSVYHKIMGYIEKSQEIEFNEKSCDILNGIMEKIVEIFEENSTELSILVNKSAGSKYENCKCVMVDFVTNAVTEAMKYQLSLKGKVLKDNFIIYLLSCSLVESIAIILREKEDGSEVRKYILGIISIFYDDIISRLDTD